MRLYNRHTDRAIPPGAVYIGRPSAWGNPYAIGRDGNRDEVVDKHRTMVLARLDDPHFRDDLRELAKAPGIVCFCRPLRCHGDNLIEAMRLCGFLPGEERQLSMFDFMQD